MHGTSRMFAAAMIAVILAPASAHAQTDTARTVSLSDSQSVPVPAPTLFKGIQLSKAQQDSVDAITRRYQALSEALNGEDADVRIRQRQFLVLRDKSRADKRALLRAEQQKVYDVNAAAQKAVDERISKALVEAMERRNP